MQRLTRNQSLLECVMEFLPEDDQRRCGYFPHNEDASSSDEEASAVIVDRRWDNNAKEIEYPSGLGTKRLSSSTTTRNESYGGTEFSTSSQGPSSTTTTETCYTSFIVIDNEEIAPSFDEGRTIVTTSSSPKGVRVEVEAETALVRRALVRFSTIFAIQYALCGSLLFFFDGLNFWDDWEFTGALSVFTWPFILQFLIVILLLAYDFSAENKSRVTTDMRGTLGFTLIFFFIAASASSLSLPDSLIIISVLGFIICGLAMVWLVRRRWIQQDDVQPIEPSSLSQSIPQQSTTQRTPPPSCPHEV